MLWELSHPVLDGIFHVASFLGEEYIYIFLLGVSYWSFHKKKSRAIASALLLSGYLNAVIKVFVNRPRPFEVIEGLVPKRLHTATGSSFPSGHTQSAATFYSSVAYHLRSSLPTPPSLNALIAGILIVAVALSRVYLGVHWPSDVVFGALLGLLLVFLHQRLPYFEEIVLIAGATVFALHFGEYNILRAYPAFLGFYLGTRAEQKLRLFSDTSCRKKRVLRSLIGILLTVIVFFGSKTVLPGSSSNLLIATRYFFTTWTVTFIAPSCFRLVQIHQ